MNRVEPPGGPGSRSLETRAQDALDTLSNFTSFLRHLRRKGWLKQEGPEGDGRSTRMDQTVALCGMGLQNQLCLGRMINKHVAIR